MDTENADFTEKYKGKSVRSVKSVSRITVIPKDPYFFPPLRPIIIYREDAKLSKIFCGYYLPDKTKNLNANYANGANFANSFFQKHPRHIVPARVFAKSAKFALKKGFLKNLSGRECGYQKAILENVALLAGAKGVKFE